MKVWAVVGFWMLAGIAGVAAGQATGSSGSAQQAPYTLQVNSRVVLTDVSVTDKHGKPVQGLTQSDFAVLDNGHPQRLASFEEHQQPAEEMPVSAPAMAPGVFSNSYLIDPPAVVNVILIDATTIGVVDQMYLYEQMRRFVEKLPAGEPAAVFDRRGDTALELQNFTSDHDLLMTARLEQISMQVNQDQERTVAHPMVQFDQAVNLPWGEDYLLVAVWDETSGRMGMLSLQVDVPKPGKAKQK